jgi:hypothetical protein
MPAQVARGRYEGAVAVQCRAHMVQLAPKVRQCLLVGRIGPEQRRDPLAALRDARVHDEVGGQRDRTRRPERTPPPASRIACSPRSVMCNIAAGPPFQNGTRGPCREQPVSCLPAEVPSQKRPQGSGEPQPAESRGPRPSSAPGSSGTSTACSCSAAIGTICRTASLVEAKTTGAATPSA